MEMNYKHTNYTLQKLIVKIRPFRYGNISFNTSKNASSEYVKIRPFRYGN